MVNKAFEISEAELEVIKVLWETGKPMNSTGKYVTPLLIRIGNTQLFLLC